MTQMGLIHLFAVLYLSGVICLSISINESRAPRRIARETLRRWAKFLGVTLAIALVIAALH